jgi:hypothetical protein
MVRTLNLGLLDRAFLERLCRANQEISVHINERNLTYEFRLTFGYAGLEPTYDGCPRRVVGLKLVVSSDLPDAQSAIASVRMSTTTNEAAWLTGMKLGGRRGENYGGDDADK